MRRALFAVALVCLSLSLFGQVTIPAPIVPQQFLDNTGTICSGCFLYTYSAGTSTPLATYTDGTGVSQNTNPVVLDSSGRASIWLGNNSYKFILQSASNVTFWTQDNINEFLLLSRNNTWSGTQTFNGAVTFSSTVSGITSLSTKTYESIRNADQFTGADCGAKINAADADLGATAGEIWVNQNCGTNWTTAVSLSANHALRFVQGGTYNTNAAITLGQSASILGYPSGQAPASANNPVILKQAASANLASLIVMSGQQSVLQDVTIDGNKSNNTTTVCVTVTGLRSELRYTNVVACPSHNIQVGDSGNNHGAATQLIHVMSLNAGGSALYLLNVADVAITNGSQFENATRYGIEASNGGSVRIDSGDLGGNTLGGIKATCTAASVGSSFWSVTGGIQFGNNFGPDIEIDGYDAVGAAYCAYGWTIGGGNQFNGLNSAATANTYDAIKLVSGGRNSIVGNGFFNNHTTTYRYDISIADTGSTALVNNIVGNSFDGTVGTGAILPNVNTSDCFNNVFGVIGNCNHLVLPNNTSLQWSDSGGTALGVVNLGADDNTYLNAKTGKQFILQNNNSTVAVVSSTGKITADAGFDASSQGIVNVGAISGATTINASGLATVGGITTGGTPTANHAVCWKTSTTLGYCSTQPDASGICTCN